MLVPSEALSHLLCSFCNNYLSVFPIHHEEETCTFTCGRCPLITDLNPVRQVAYEKLAQFMKFPCQYEENGCMESYTPHELLKHEASCTYQPYFCPFLPLGECPWQGQCGELFEHFSESHRAMMLSNCQLEIDLINSYEENYVFMHERKTFIAYLKCNTDRDEFYCCVRYFGPDDESSAYTYKINLSNDKGKQYEFSARQVQTVKANVLDPGKALCIDISNIRLNLHDPNYVLFNVVIAKTETVAPQDKIKSQISLLEEDMLRNIECPICLQYMVAPIMQCNTGHSICESCRDEINECPTCRDALGNTRNFSLEEFTRFLKYPCKYRDYGCDFTSNSAGIRDHEANCKLGPFKCPLNDCKWKNKFSMLMDHVRDDHEDNYLDLDSVTYIGMPGICEEVTFVTDVFESVFKLYFVYDGTNYFWSVQAVGEEDQYKYMFELNISSGDSKERIFVRRSCAKLTDNAQAFAGDNPFVELRGSLLKSMLLDGDVLVYNYKIIKEKL